MGLFDQPPRELQAFLAQNRVYGTTQRYRDAVAAETYYNSLQYETLPSADSRGPLRKKKPRIVVPLFKTAIDTLARFIWGGARFPKMVVSPSRKDADAPDLTDVGPELFAEEAKDLNTFLNDLVFKGHLDRTIREASSMALITTSAAIILGCRGGYLYARTETGKHCIPTFDPQNPRAVQSLEIRYQFEREESTGQQGYIHKRLYWYRRVIDDKSDTVYRPVLVQPGMVEPDWQVDPDATVEHGLGFCPVIWIRTLPISSDTVDGQPVIDPALYPMLDRINYTASQRDRSIEYTCDPQFFATGIPTNQRGAFSAKNPGALWFADKEAKVEILEMKGNAQEAAAHHLSDLRTKFLEACSIVLADPNWLKGSGHISGIVLEYLYAPMMALAADLRKDFGNEAFCDLLNMALRMCSILSDRGEDVWIPGIKKASGLVKKAQLSGVWLPFQISLQWGPYFTPNAQDQQLKVATAVQAVMSGLISKNTATQYLSDVFGILDTDTERELADQDMTEMMGSLGGGMLQPPGVPLANAGTKPKQPVMPKVGKDPKRPGQP